MQVQMIVYLPVLACDELVTCLSLCNNDHSGISYILVLRLSLWPLHYIRSSPHNYCKASFKPLNVCVTLHCKIRFRVIV